MRQRRALHTDKEINPTRRYNNCKYICTQKGAPKYIKQILTDIKKEIDTNTIIVGDYNTPLISMNRSSSRNINKETLALKDPLD